MIDAGGETKRSVWGEYFSTWAKGIGLAGLIIDGATRDVTDIEPLGFPVFARAVTPRKPTMQGPGEVNVPVSCGGVCVVPGDIIVGRPRGRDRGAAAPARSRARRRARHRCWRKDAPWLQPRRAPGIPSLFRTLIRPADHGNSRRQGEVNDDPHDPQIPPAVRRRARRHALGSTRACTGRGRFRGRGHRCGRHHRHRPTYRGTASGTCRSRSRSTTRSRSAIATSRWRPILPPTRPRFRSTKRFGPEKASYAIRGFNQEGTTAPTVGVYFADVVGIRSQSGTTGGNSVGAGAFMDLQNVQVLKGPQGTLFGRNTTGGAILLVPQKPTDRLEGYIEGTLGNYDAKRVMGAINIPLADTFKVRIAADPQPARRLHDQQIGRRRRCVPGPRLLRGTPQHRRRPDAQS